jgi:hypothetical protein
MSNILKFDSIHEYDTFVGVETLHPLINSIDFSDTRPIKQALKRYGFYYKAGYPELFQGNTGRIKAFY